ncbi:MAG: helix-turn-helix transcriptional regulator [Solirubrobacteraceae bacterium]
MSDQIIARPAADGDALRRIRQAKGISIELLAVCAGVSSATVRRIEAGQGRPHRTTVEALAAALGRPASDLYGADA